MANYIVSYDLNGPKPTHKEMDDHMETAGWSRARILETVWWVGTSQTRSQVYNHVNEILSKNDQVIVVAASGANWRNLLVTSESLLAAWNANAK
jgi:hypothetical protein